MKKGKILLALVVLVATLFSSCAMIFTGSKATVAVKKGTPESAMVYYNGSYQGTAPCQVKVAKNSLKTGNATVTIKAKGYKETEVKLGRKMMPGAFVGDFLGFPLAHIIDFATGDIYRAYPKKIEYNLEKE